MNNENQSTAQLELVARQYIERCRPTCTDLKDAAQRLLKDHQVRTAHCQLLPELDKPNCRYIEQESRMAIEWVYLHLGEDELLRERCRRVLVANALHILKREESCLVEEPEKKRFHVIYGVKRSGRHEMVVDAENEAEARNIAQGILDKSDASSFANVKTEFIAAEVYEANEERGLAK